MTAPITDAELAELEQALPLFTPLGISLEVVESLVARIKADRVAPYHTLQETIDHLATFPAGCALLARLERATADCERYRNECNNLTDGIRDAHAQLDSVVDADGEHALSGTLAQRIAQLHALVRAGIAP